MCRGNNEMYIGELISKLQKGMILGGNEVYLREESIVYGIDSVFERATDNSITILKSSKDTIRAEEFIGVLAGIQEASGDREVLISSKDKNSNGVSPIKHLEFMQYEEQKILVINL
jgi:hypothetical protein